MVERSKQIDKMESILDTKSYDQDIQSNTENDKYMICRICYDEDKNESTISPCNCVGSHAHVHVSCLEQWLSVSNSTSCDICSYTFKTVEHYMTMAEWLRYKRSCGGFCRQFSIVFFFVSTWFFVITICALKTVEYFTDNTDNYSFCNGFLMSIITLAMSIMLWFWIMILSSMWKRVNLVVRLDESYYNENVTTNCTV